MQTHTGREKAKVEEAGEFTCEKQRSSGVSISSKTYFRGLIVSIAVARDMVIDFSTRFLAVKHYTTFKF